MHAVIPRNIIVRYKLYTPIFKYIHFFYRVPIKYVPNKSNSLLGK